MMVGGEVHEPTRPVGGSARRRARQVALQVLYAIDLATGRPRSRPRGDTANDPLLDVALEVAAQGGAAPDAGQVFESVAAHFEMPGAARAFAQELALGARREIEEIDGVISRHARNWRIDRMAAVDRNILRLATFELSSTDTPTAVVLDEAIDLARQFGDDPSPGFVNGILDAIARDLREKAK